MQVSIATASAPSSPAAAVGPIAAGAGIAALLCSLGITAKAVAGVGATGSDNHFVNTTDLRLVFGIGNSA